MSKRRKKKGTIFNCRPDCSECCGPVPISIHIYKKFRHLAENITETFPFVSNEIFVINDIKCAFLKDNRCLIYKFRPKVCRKYGTIPELRCPYIDIDGRIRDKPIIESINAEVDRKINELKKSFEVE